MTLIKVYKSSMERWICKLECNMGMNEAFNFDTVLTKILHCVNVLHSSVKTRFTRV